MENLNYNPNIDEVRRGETPKNDEIGRGEKPKTVVSEKFAHDLEVSDSDSSSLMSVASCISEDREDRFWRKRPLKTVKSGHSSDSSDKEEPLKVAKRGRGRPPTTGQYVGLHKAKKEVEEAKRKEEEIKIAAEEKRRAYLTQPRVIINRLSCTSASEAEKDADECTASELKSRMQNALGQIKSVAKVSKGLKGTCQKTLKQAISDITEIAETLVERTSSAEVVKLRAENAKLAAQMRDMAALQESLRADLASLRKERLGDPPAPSTDTSSDISRLLAEMASLNARFSFMEGRLLRPSLGARVPAPAPTKPVDATTYASKAAAAKPVAAPSAEPPPSAAPSVPANTSAGLTAANGKSNKKKKKSVQHQTASASTSAQATGQESASAPATQQAGEWQTAGANKKDKSEKKKEAKKAAKAAKRLRVPRSTAVVITLQASAKERGVDYASILKTAKANIKLEDLEMPAGLKVKATRTGARLIEIPGTTSGPKADALAQKLRATFDAADVTVSRPTKTADLRITGLDDSVTSSEIVAAIAAATGCSPGDVKSGSIKTGIRGLGSVVVSCPISAAQKLAKGGRILVGWVSAQVKLLEPRLTRCYRCFATGHVGVKCTATVDCSDKCFRCSQPGHKAASCNATPHCFMCVASGKPAEHRVGSKACAGPKPKPQEDRRSNPAKEQPAPNNAAQVMECN